MKVVNRKQLMREPLGTVYSHYQECIITGLYRLYEVLRNAEGPFDFYEEAILPEFISPPKAEWEIGIISREGSFNETAQFIVYDRLDLTQMAQRMFRFHAYTISSSTLKARHDQILEDLKAVGTIPSLTCFSCGTHRSEPGTLRCTQCRETDDPWLTAGPTTPSDPLGDKGGSVP